MKTVIKAYLKYFKFTIPILITLIEFGLLIFLINLFINGIK